MNITNSNDNPKSLNQVCHLSKRYRILRRKYETIKPTTPKHKKHFHKNI